ncbi:MAG: ribulose-phosphate 3-epimerase [Actinomycetota bacterium]
MAASDFGALRIAPSILSADFGDLGSAIGLISSQVEWLHVDVMDGHFVPNITIGPPVVKSLRQHSDLFFDCHLMISEPWRYLEDFKKAGADSCTFHVEVGRTAETIQLARDLGMRVGLSLNPDKSFALVEPFLSQIDVLLVMSVFPGFGGQSFIPEALETVEKARAVVVRDGLNLDIEIDGGIDVTTAPLAVKAGANVLVAGNAIFGKSDPAAALRDLQATVASL